MLNVDDKGVASVHTLTLYSMIWLPSRISSHRVGFAVNSCFNLSSTSSIRAAVPKVIT